jgi:UBX domain-containing protein 1
MSDEAGSNNAVEEVVQYFIDVTGLNRERTEFFLQAANWDLQVSFSFVVFFFIKNFLNLISLLIKAALSSFYEAQEDEAGGNVAGGEREVASAQQPTLPVLEKPTGKSTEKPKFATLKNLESSSSDEDDDEKGQTFYAGGSEHSGQQIVGPPRKNPIRDMVSDIFRSAHSGNMETFDPADVPGAAGSSRGPRFSGMGYRLGETSDDTVAVNTGPNREKSDSDADVKVIKVYRQGFTVDDGELRSYEDPKNKEFFECIMRKEIPAEFRKPGSRMVHLNVEDHLHDEYVKKAPRFQAFTGSGHTLVSSVITNILILIIIP